VDRHSQGWPPLTRLSLPATVAHLHRLVQVAGKYTLDELFEPGWGNVVFDVAPRGLRTPTFLRGEHSFEVYYRLLDHCVRIETNGGVHDIELRDRSVAEFYDEFRVAVLDLGLPAPVSALTCEITDAPDLDLDHQHRPWDTDAAREIWSALALTSTSLRDWQAPYRGHRPRVGVMWGGFDLSATRYKTEYTPPPGDRPAFMQHGMIEHYISVGFAFGTDLDDAAYLYAYVSPQPAGMEAFDWTSVGARWSADEGLVRLPWEAVIGYKDPRRAILDFGDHAYAAAVALAGWPREWVTDRFSGWQASHNPPELPLDDDGPR
jgi:hypothetical protein